MVPVAKKQSPILSLKNSREFDLLNRKGKSLQGRLVRVVAAPRLGEGSTLRPGSRLGITISKKISKLAVERNLFRRRIKEISRTKLRSVISGFDVHIIARHGGHLGTGAELFEEISKLLRSILTK